MTDDSAPALTSDQARAIEWDCQRLILQYANLNDQRRWSEVAAFYLEDGRLTRPSAPGAPIVGQQAILQSFLERPAKITKHICANIVVTPESSSRASAYSAYLIYSASSETSDRPCTGPPLICEFHDSLCLTEAGWRFVERLGATLFSPDPVAGNLSQAQPPSSGA